MVCRDAHATGIDFLVGFETEFVLLKSTDPVVPVDAEGSWCSVSALPAGATETRCLEEIADSLELAGIEVLMYHREVAPGQFEIVTGPRPPLEAADILVQTRETIYATATKFGLRATLAPRVFAESCELLLRSSSVILGFDLAPLAGTGAHAHISLHCDKIKSENLRSIHPDSNHSTTLNPLERSFLQALLTHLPSLSALTQPTNLSYARVQDGIWSGGTYTSWGTDNREALVRLTGPQGAHHLEVKSIDGTANPHVALAAVLGAGLAGVREALELEVQECLVPAWELSEEERKNRGITGRMPLSLDEARELLRGSKVVTSIFGEEFMEKYLSVNKVSPKF